MSDILSSKRDFSSPLGETGDKQFIFNNEISPKEEILEVKDENEIHENEND